MAKPDKSKLKKRMFSALRIIVSAGLLFFLVRTQLKDFTYAVQIIKSASIAFILISFSMHFFGIWITAVRWNVLLRTQNITYSTNFLLSSVLIGFFFSNFLPTSIGGDIYRAYDTSKAENSSIFKSTSVIIMERSTGIISAVTYLIVALFLGFTQIKSTSIILPVIIVFLLAVFLVILLLFPERFKLHVLFRKMKFLHRFKEKIKAMYDTFKSFRTYKKALAKTMLLSFGLQFCVVLNYYFCSVAFGINLNIMSFLFIVPMVAIVAMIPISIGGIGIRENSLVFLMVTLGASSQKSAIVSIVLFLMLLVPGIVGGIIYAVRPYIGKKLENIKSV